MRRKPNRLKLVADKDDTLLGFVVRRGGISEGEARGAIERGGAYLRGKRVCDASIAVRKGDAVEVVLRVAEVPALEKSRLLHLDGEVIAVDKPAGVSAQEELAGGPSLPGLCTALLAELGEPEPQALLVHRLDKGTTGVTVLARTRSGQAALLEEFRQHRVRKEYRALVANAPEADEGFVEAAVEGARAATRYRVLERFETAALLAAFPETGRTHQIRLHLRPLLGDTRYGGPAFLTRADGTRIDFTRPMLHALALSVHGLNLRAPVPPDFEQALGFLRGSR